MRQDRLRSADGNRHQKSLGADLPVDRQRDGGGKKDTHAGGGYRARNEDALFQ
jgi:hypothetical protein